MSRRSKTHKSLFRRLVYFVVMVMTGGSAGMGGWFFKDHPQLQVLTEAVFGKSVEEIGEGEKTEIKDRLATAVSKVLSSDSKGPGVYKVRITELKLDPKQFTSGKTVDIQAEVRKIDAQGKNVLVWESKSFGENLAVVGRDDLAVDWTKRPFEIEWNQGDQIVVSAWDRKAGFFSPKTFKMLLPDPDKFPLASGSHGLAVVSSRSAEQSAVNRIVFDSQRTGDGTGGSSREAVARKGSNRPVLDVAERPIIIK